MKIGIGIPTYNRLESLQKVVNYIGVNADVDFDLFISIDGSTDGTINWVNGNFEFNMQNRQGVCFAKNAILRRFRDYDYIFIIEDDLIVKKPGVFGMYINAMKVFKIQHINFLVESQRSSAKPNKTKEGLTMMYSKLLGGSFSVYTKEVIRRVGAFNPKFKGYGHGHCEHTMRVSRTGLTSPWGQFAHLVDAEEYLYHDHIQSASKKEEVKTQKEINHKKLKESLNDSSLIYIPL